MTRRVVVLCGGVGGAKLARGLDAMDDTGALLVVVNTGDDMEHLGLHVSPDIDTVLYTLADLNDPVRGWGRRDETWNCMSALAELGGETWFGLGDRDLALHLERTRRLRSGEPLSAIVRDFAQRFGVRANVVPMTDDPVRTRVHTSEGAVAFQDYFVRRQCAPCITRIEFEGASTARAHPVLLEALPDPEVRAVVIAPSNPYLSIGPILALPGVRDALRRAPAPVVAVSPIVAREAVKGPTAKIMRELDVPVTSASIAQHYGDVLDGLVADDADAADLAHVDVPVLLTHTLMRDLDDRRRLACEVLRFADEVHACVA